MEPTTEKLLDDNQQNAETKLLIPDQQNTNQENNAAANPDNGTLPKENEENLANQKAQKDLEQLLYTARLKNIPVEIISYLLVIVLYYFITKKTMFVDDKCEQLRVYGIYNIYVLLGYVVIGVYQFIQLWFCPSYWALMWDKVFKIIGFVVIAVFFQIGYVACANCGALGIFVCLYLIGFYMFITCGACVLCLLKAYI